LALPCQLTLILLLCTSLAFALEVEAVFEDVVQGPDGGDQVHMHWSNNTLTQMPAIVTERVRHLSSIYCGHTATELALFAAEHGPAFGVNNETVPGFDAYDVAMRVLMVLETVDRLPVLSEAALECHASVFKKQAATPKRQLPFLVLACMAERQEAERATMPGDEVFRRWTGHINANAALDALGQLLQCYQQMTRLAMHQLDLEYRRDGLRKAHAAGKLSADKLASALARTRVPTRVDYQRALLAMRNATLHHSPIANVTNKSH
jgi:hypothetical protein